MARERLTALNALTTIFCLRGPEPPSGLLIDGEFFEGLPSKVFMGAKKALIFLGPFHTG